MVLKTILIFMVIFVLMEDSASIRKTVEEEKEDEEVARAVNRTLAEEERKRKEEENEAKRTKKEEKTEKKKEDEDERTDVKGKDEACPPTNSSCPIVGPCPEVRDCLEEKVFPEKKPCKECPKPVEQDCPPCQPCRPCGPCPMVNSTVSDLPPTSACPEAPEMSLPAAVAVGVVAGILLTGVATTIGVLLRYLSPIESGFIFLATIIIVWYLCSHHPETARELGGRAATLLREAATALSHRVMEALRHHHEQVGLPSNLSFLLKLSSKFHFRKSLH
jgi:hypothetical protein